MVGCQSALSMLKIVIVVCFHRFHRVDSPAAKGGEKWGCGVLKCHFGTAGTR